MRSRRLVAALVVVVLAVVAGVAWLAFRPSDDAPSASSKPAATATPDSTPTAGASASPAKGGPGCTPSDVPFDPRTIKVAGATVKVITPPRDANNVPGVPPLTDTGKLVFAYDLEQGVHPGDRAGNVLLNAHTYPDGSALGNRLLKSLKDGDQIVVKGLASQVLCYRVTSRTEVPAAKGLASYYATNGPPQLAIVVCSGRRLGPGEWEDRTIWFASPV